MIGQIFLGGSMRRLGVFALSVGLGVVSVALFAQRFRQSVYAQSVPVKPFTATYNITEFFNEMPRAPQLQGFMRRSDGSNVVLHYRPDPRGGTKLMSINVVSDFTTKKATRVMQFIDTTTTYPIQQAEANRLETQLRAGCTAESAGSMLGYDVVKTREVLVNSDTVNLGPAYDRMQHDRWLAPALNCAPLRVEVTFYKDNKLVQRRVETALTVLEGEPDASAFQIPAGYVERTPGEAMLEADRRYPNDPLFGFRGGHGNVQPLDTVYRRANSTE